MIVFQTIWKDGTTLPRSHHRDVAQCHTDLSPARRPRYLHAAVQASGGPTRSSETGIGQTSADVWTRRETPVVIALGGLWGAMLPGTDGVTATATRSYTGLRIGHGVKHGYTDTGRLCLCCMYVCMYVRTYV